MGYRWEQKVQEDEDRRHEAHLNYLLKTNEDNLNEKKRGRTREDKREYYRLLMRRKELLETKKRYEYFTVSDKKDLEKTNRRIETYQRGIEEIYRKLKPGFRGSDEYQDWENYQKEEEER